MASANLRAGNIPCWLIEFRVFKELEAASRWPIECLLLAEARNKMNNNIRQGNRKIETLKGSAMAGHWPNGSGSGRRVPGRRLARSGRIRVS